MTAASDPVQLIKDLLKADAEYQSLTVYSSAARVGAMQDRRQAAYDAVLSEMTSHAAEIARLVGENGRLLLLVRGLMRQLTDRDLGATLTHSEFAALQSICGKSLDSAGG
jgi:hypothetical protein